MNDKTPLNEFDKIVTKDPVKARNLIKKLDYKDDYHVLQRIALSYWIETKFDKFGNWQKKSDNKKLRIAESYIIKAFEIKPTCSDVLWLLALIRWDYGQIDIAIYCFKEIIRLGVKGIVYGGCKKELKVGLSQINDSKFQLSRLYKEINPSLSKRYLTLYKKGLKKGIKTLYKPLTNFL